MDKRNLWFSLPLLLLGCGGKTTPWEPEAATVHDADGQIENRSLEDAECGGLGAADVYLDRDGNIVDVVCYPPASEVGTTRTLTGSELDGDFVVDNKDIIVLDGEPALTGDLEIDGNNVILWGDDPATSILDGNLAITKNNALVAGITITGDVHVTFNNAQFTNCVIEGQLILDGNNAKVAGCRIEGNVIINGNNNVLGSNVLLGGVSVVGENTVCRENYSGPGFGEGELVGCP